MVRADVVMRSAQRGESTGTSALVLMGYRRGRERCATLPDIAATEGVAMTQTPQTPAGWYPQGDVQRWWDGNAWTEHTQPLPGAQPTMQQPAVQAGQPQYGAPAYGAPQPYQPPQPAEKSHTARNVLIIIGAIFLLLV